MIKSIKLENFQSHKNTTLDLSPGVNVVVGPSDSGKTAIVRALRWLVWNKPGGTAFRSTWGGDTVVSIMLSEGPTIIRTRTAKSNTYEIDAREEEEDDANYHHFAAFGSEPPEDVSALLNFSDVNLQQQLDRPFLLDSSPGQVAAYLNEVARLDVIDTALQRIGRWTRKVESDVQTQEHRKQELEETLASYSYLSGMEQDVERLEAQEQQVQAVRRRAERLSTLLSGLVDVSNARAALDALTSLAPAVNAALRALQRIQQLKQRRALLSRLLTRIESVDSQLKRTRPLQALEPHVEHALRIVSSINEIKKDKEALASLLLRIRNNAADRKALRSKIDSMHQEFDKAMGDRCPLCQAKR